MTAIAEVHPNDIAVELTGRPYTSWSAITTYTSCPLRYEFRYIQNLPEDSVSASHDPRPHGGIQEGGGHVGRDDEGGGEAGISHDGTEGLTRCSPLD